MAYRGNNLLLMEQRRAAIDEARRQRQHQNIQQAMAIAEDIKNQQFERQRKQAEAHGRLAEQLMLKREPFAQAPIEESAMLGQMQAQADRQKILEQQRRQDELMAQRAKQERERQAEGLKGRLKIERTKRYIGRSNKIKMLKNLVDTAESNKKIAENRLKELNKPNPWRQGTIGNPEQIAQAEADLKKAKDEHFYWSREADKAEYMGYLSPEAEEGLGVQPGEKPRRGGGRGKKGQGAMPPPAKRPSAPEQIADPIIQSIERRKTEDPLGQSIEQTAKRKKLYQAREELHDLQKEKLDDLEAKVAYMEIPKFDEALIRDLAAEYLSGDDATRIQINRIIKRATAHPDQPQYKPITLRQWQNALLQKSGRERAPAPAEPAGEPSPVSAETNDETFNRIARQRLEKRKR